MTETAPSTLSRPGCTLPHNQTTRLGNYDSQNKTQESSQGAAPKDVAFWGSRVSMPMSLAIIVFRS